MVIRLSVLLKKVAMDVKNEYITVEQAKADYGVLVDPETFKVLGLTEERQKAEKIISYSMYSRCRKITEIRNFAALLV